MCTHVRKWSYKFFKLEVQSNKGRRRKRCWERSLSLWTFGQFFVVKGKVNTYFRPSQDRTSEQRCMDVALTLWRQRPYNFVLTSWGCWGNNQWSCSANYIVYKLLESKNYNCLKNISQKVFSGCFNSFIFQNLPTEYIKNSARRPGNERNRTRFSKAFLQKFSVFYYSLCPLYIWINFDKP